jgi:hypothetical protein
LKTRSQFKKIFQDFATAHLQIHSFGYGQEFEQQAKEGLEYPLLWVVANSSPLNGVDMDYSYRLIIADRVRKDETDEIDVESDTDLILKDAIAYMWKYAQNNGMQFIDGLSIETFYEKWSDEVTGNFVDITIRDYFDYNSCTIPISGEIPSGEFGCAVATLTVNGVSYTTVASGDTYNLVVKDTNGLSVGSKIGEQWIVPPASGGGATELELIEYANIYG